MGTEQQQELKSEKRKTGSQIKTVLFTDHSIESWRPKKIGIDCVLDKILTIVFSSL